MATQRKDESRADFNVRMRLQSARRAEYLREYRARPENIQRKAEWWLEYRERPGVLEAKRQSRPRHYEVHRRWERLKRIEGLSEELIPLSDALHELNRRIYTNKRYRKEESK